MITSWNAVGKSVQGTSHTKSGLPCQDANAFTVMESGVFLGIVSDGAGSAARSELGAYQAVNQAMLALYTALSDEIPETEELWGELVTHAFRSARAGVLKLPATEGGEARDYACTLTIVIADQDWLITGQVGDGMAVAQTLQGDLHVIADPQRGEYADSTFFLTSANAEDVFTGRVYRQGADIAPVSALSVMTDGLINLALDRSARAPFPPFFNPLLRFAADIANPDRAGDELHDFLSSERVNNRTDDDKTLILAARPESDSLAAYYSL